METETGSDPNFVRDTLFANVKLNNPLMGTETLNPTISTNYFLRFL